MGKTFLMSFLAAFVFSLPMVLPYKFSFFFDSRKHMYIYTLQA
jgi:hypothetical protein